jgi:hypothetical protein
MMFRMPHSKLVRLAIALTPLALGLARARPIQAQACQETAQIQIENALDKSTHRILLQEVVDDYGEEGKQVLVQIARDYTQTS